MGLYILEGREFRLAHSMKEWGEYMQPRPDDPYYRHVAHTKYIVNEEEYCSLSTVFLGINHNYSDGDPILFESMIFGGDLNEETWRHIDWTEAKDQHYLIHTNRIIKHLKEKFDTVVADVRSSLNSVGELDISEYYFKSVVRPRPAPPPKQNLHRLIRED